MKKCIVFTLIFVCCISLMNFNLYDKHLVDTINGTSESTNEEYKTRDLIGNC